MVNMQNTKIVILSEQNIDCKMDCVICNPREHKNLIAAIKALSPDILVTTDLEGFEQCTLTDNISYNLLDCKQIHLLCNENLENEKYLGKQLSIAMFFFCVGDEYYNYLKNKYPNLPYLKKISDVQIGMVEALDIALDEVAIECGMISTS